MNNSMAEDEGWIPHSTGSMTKTSTRTYTAPDGSVVTEVSRSSIDFTAILTRVQNRAEPKCQFSCVARTIDVINVFHVFIQVMFLRLLTFFIKKNFIKCKV